jgi:hypothetical protein
MGNYKEDTNQNFRTILFIVLFSLSALIFSSESESRTSPSSGYSSQNEQIFGDNPIHFEATVLNVVSLPDLFKNRVFAPHNTSLNQFSLQYKISGYNHRTTQNLINIQKTRLVIEPLFHWRLYRPRSLSGKEDLPVLG